MVYPIGAQLAAWRLWHLFPRRAGSLLSPGSSAAWRVEVEIFGEYGAALALEPHLTPSRGLQQISFWGLCFGVVISAQEIALKY